MLDQIVYQVVRNCPEPFHKMAESLSDSEASQDSDTTYFLFFSNVTNPLLPPHMEVPQESLLLRAGCPKIIYLL